MVKQTTVDDEQHDDDEGVLTLHETPQDIDPAEWLSGSDVNEMEDRFFLRNGSSIKLAAITDKEEHGIRISSTKVNVKNPQGPRQLDVTRYRRNMIAASVNKAYGRTNVMEPGFVTPEALGNRPVGELTKMLEKIMEISGSTPTSVGGNTANEAIDFLS